jgi:polyisoprenoid-binding protein YceI
VDGTNPRNHLVQETKEETMKNTYQIDAAHSHVQFSVRHLMVSNVRGTFSGVTGTVSYDPDKPAETTIDATIDVNSVNTNDEKRDGHLKSADFFDVAQYPTMVFKSKVVEAGTDQHKVIGDLTLHGVTKEVSLLVEEVSGESKDPWGNIKIGASVKGKIKRSDFGLVWNAALETGGVVIGDDVKLEFDIEFLKAAQGATA